MPYRRRTFRRRRLRRGHANVRRVPRDFTRFLRRPVPGLQNVALRTHSFKVTQVRAPSQTTLGVLLQALNFRLSYLTNVAEYSALFDQYRINCVVVKIVWRSSTASVIESSVNNSVGMPIMYHCLDFDDSTTPVSVAELRERGNCRMTYFSPLKRTQTIKLYPRNLNTIFRTGVSNAYALGRRKAWLDMTNTDVDHYGVKLAVEMPQAGGTIVEGYFDIINTVYFQCKGQR